MQGFCTGLRLQGTFSMPTGGWFRSHYNAKDSKWGAGAGRVVGVRGGDRDAGVLHRFAIARYLLYANWGMV